MRLTNNPSTSEMTLGGYDSSHFSGNLSYHNLISQTYWTINLSGFAVGSTYNAVDGKAIIDSGTSFIVGNTAWVNQLTSGIKVNSNCNNIKSLPNISFFLDHIEYVLTPNDYIIKFS